jgi:hypothetical protein
MGMIPYGAVPILKARQQGKRPADMVLVSMVGPLPNELNPVVIADKDVSYDWEWIRGLTACFWASPEGYIAKHILDCSKARPSRLYLWDYANEKGYDISVLPLVESIGRPQDQWQLHVFADRWLPFQEKQFAQGEIQWS